MLPRSMVSITSLGGRLAFAGSVWWSDVLSAVAARRLVVTSKLRVGGFAGTWRFLVIQKPYETSVPDEIGEAAALG
jgi:hypothetical protein